MTGRQQRLFWPLVRIGVAVLFVVGLANIVDLGEGFSIIAGVSPATTLLVLLLFGTGQVLSSLRWRLALSRITSARPSLPALLRLYLIGMFVNLGVPTMAGGDIVRAEMLRQTLGTRGGAYASILADRLIGVLAVCLIAIAAVLVAGDQILSVTGPAVVQAALVFGAGLVALFLLLRWLAAGQRWPFLAALGALAQSPRLLALCLFIAVVVQAGAVMLPIALLARAMGIDIPVASHFVLVPIIVIVTLLPIAPNGIGLRETAFVVLYGQFGVAPEAAFALGLAWSLVLSLFGLAGGLVLACSARHMETNGDGQNDAAR